MTALDHAMQEYLHILHTNANQHELTPTLRYDFTVEPGRKFLKVVQTLAGSNSKNTSVHSFIEKSTGDIYKPASWKIPAKDARYNLFSDMGLLSKVADPYGGYLYKSTAEKAHA